MIYWSIVVVVFLCVNSSIVFLCEMCWSSVLLVFMCAAQCCV